MKRTTSILLLGACCAISLPAGDWPMWGRTPARNFYTPEKNLPADFDPGRFKRGSDEVDLTTTRHVRWVAKLGSQTYGNPTVAGGRVFVGTNNESPRDPRIQGDHSILMCFDEKTGQFLWQLVVPKLGAGKVSDWEFLGICSSPSVDGDRVYIVTSRCEVMCLDVHGLANGNQGYQDEGQYMAGPGKPPLTPGARDADIIWVFDMREELGVFPHNITSSSVLVLEDRVVATTSNGQDWSHNVIPSPLAPALVVLDKKTGELLGEESSGISQRLYHCNWSSPAFGVIKGQPTIIFGAGDGNCYGFDPNPIEGEEGLMILKELWRHDCIPAKYKMRDGKPIKYPAADGPSEIISTPVVYKDRVYVAIGQDPEHGEGVGNLSCIDASNGQGIWNFDQIHRSISTASIDPETGLLFIADYSGYLYCLDADTGQLYWKYDMLAHVWGSTLVGDGKVYLGDEDGDLVILPARKDFNPETDEPILEVMFPTPIYSSPVVAHGVLYIATPTHLYAIGR